MTDPEAVRKTNNLEKELATLQSERTTYLQLEAKLQQEKLDETLTTAQIVSLASRRIIRGFGRTVDAATTEIMETLAGGND